jgi:Homeodomain-like domain
MARNVKYTVRLEPEERQQLLDLVTKGKRAAATLTRARILLKADAGPQGPGWDDEVIAEAVETSLSTVHRVRQDFVEESFEEALYRKKPTGRQYRKLDGDQEAHLIAVACSEAPEGRSRWTLQLLAAKLVELKVVDSISSECVRTTLKKTTSSHGYADNG